MTLTKTASTVKRGVVLSIVLVITYYISLFVIIPLAKGALSSLFPTRNPPTPIYGKLQQLEFVETALDNQQPPAYKLDTKTGRLPDNMPDRMTVYRFRPVPFSYQSGKNAIDSASVLGFYNEDLVTDLKGTTFTWRKILSNGVLEINKDTKEVSLLTPLNGTSDKFPRGRLFASKIIDTAKKLLTDIQRFDDELYKNGRQTVLLGKFQNNALVPTEITVEAQIARVDFFRKINNYDIVTPTFRDGLIYMYVREPQRDEIFYNYPVVETHIWEIESQSNATYPIIPVSQVWTRIQNNEGVLVSVTPKDGNLFRQQLPTKVEEIFIDNIYLAYYDSIKLQKFLQPIYVFEGKYTTAGTQGGSIAIYYPAISGEYIE